jgi:hypothetical protein
LRFAVSGIHSWQGNREIIDLQAPRTQGFSDLSLVELSEGFLEDSSLISCIPFLNSRRPWPRERITLGKRLPNIRNAINASTNHISQCVGPNIKTPPKTMLTHDLC